MIDFEDLTEEQKELIVQVQNGRNVLVDACIGSGKTTTIQVLCNTFTEKKILYLTYNKLLKLDAKNKIQNKNVLVTNYHGFAYAMLIKKKIKAGISDLIQVFNRVKPRIPHYDIIVIDEYQDIEQEIADMLDYIKSKNPNAQIVAVGDMKQQIYDKTTLDVLEFMEEFLGDYEVLHFTYCFRLSPILAKRLGRIWGKKIVGVNQDCKIQSMNQKEIVQFLSEQKPEDILCLGTRGNGTNPSQMSRCLNRLEAEYPEKFNKKTVFASIRDKGEGGATEPNEKTAIFTTYDGSKGLERKICVIFDFTEENWFVRTSFPMTRYDIMRNIFCVASSRGKEKIIFVKSEEAEHPLGEKTLSTPTEMDFEFKDFGVASMFDFKYKEDIEKCYQMLQIEEIPMTDQSDIEIKNHDELIDLSPCIGTYQEAMFFENFDIDNELEYLELVNKDFNYNVTRTTTLGEKILQMTAFETGQNRYIKQVEVPFVTPKQTEELKNRIGSVLSPMCCVQVESAMKITAKKKSFFIDGRCDVLENDCIYELKFVSELKHENFLQLACYLLSFGMEKGILWNTKKNQMYQVKIPDKEKFLKAVILTITKGYITDYEVEFNAKTVSERNMTKKKGFDTNEEEE